MKRRVINLPPREIFIMMLIASFCGCRFQGSPEAVCKENLEQLGIAVVLYRADHNDLPPAAMEDLYPGYVTDTRVLRCPLDTTTSTTGDVRAAFSSSSYAIDATEARLLLERQAPHDGKRHVVARSGIVSLEAP
jgi:hypothetical protein